LFTPQVITSDPTSLRADIVMRFAAWVMSYALTCGPCIAAEEDIFKNRPAFSLGDQPAIASAQCHEIRKMSDGLPRYDGRIDFSSEGALTLVRSDGALWYLVMCSDVRVMCVTYESNDMKVGDTVVFRGGYKRMDANHVLLDPCLANRP
jgi:hypothetical protein